MPERAPEAFGIEGLKRWLKEPFSALHTAIKRLEELLQPLKMRQDLNAIRVTVERIESEMANGFDQLKGLLADQGGLIQAEAAQVNAKLDEQTQLIQQLQDQINQGTTVPQEVVDALMANNEAIKGIFADVAPTPAPEPVPEPAPEPGRRR